MKSATQSWFGAVAVKARSTRSGERASFGSGILERALLKTGPHGQRLRAVIRTVEEQALPWTHRKFRPFGAAMLLARWIRAADQ